VPAAGVAAGALFSGAAGAVFNPLWETSLQRHIPRRALSRVSAYDWLMSLALAPIGQILVGLVSAGIGVDATLWCAAAVFVVGAGAVLTIRDVRELRNDEVSPEVEEQVVDGEGER
jgi:predicted MFS family arabinose efflux permease